jgi:hypothetical protein
VIKKTVGLDMRTNRRPARAGVRAGQRAAAALGVCTYYNQGRIHSLGLDANFFLQNEHGNVFVVIW